MSDERPRYFSLAKALNDFHPDLQLQGGLPQALQAAFHDIGSNLTASSSTFWGFLVHAVVRSGSRSSQIFVAQERRWFSVDFWAHGVLLAQGGTSELTAVARAVDTWMTTECTAAVLAAAFPFIRPEADADVYERGDETEHKWDYYLSQTDLPVHPFIVAASRRPELRQLFPFTSLLSFRFSRCTGYPFSGETPYVWPLAEGRFQLNSRSHEKLAMGTAEEVADLAVRQLPPDCGPARPGTAVELGLPIWSAHS